MDDRVPQWRLSPGSSRAPARVLGGPRLARYRKPRRPGLAELADAVALRSLREATRTDRRPPTVSLAGSSGLAEPLPETAAWQAGGQPGGLSSEHDRQRARERE